MLPDMPRASAGRIASSSAVLCCAGTARIVERQGVEVAFVPCTANAVAFAQELPQPQADEASDVLYPASQRAASTLQRGLADRGFAVTRLDTYDTVAVTADDILPGELGTLRSCSVVAVASPSALKAWMRIVGDDVARQAVIACIGSTTGAAAIRQGLAEESVLWPEKPGMPGLVDSIDLALLQAERARVP
jgi:uroporphyrinogen-III synthase